MQPMHNTSTQRDLAEINQKLHEVIKLLLIIAENTTPKRTRGPGRKTNEAA